MSDNIFELYRRCLAVSTDTRRVQPGDLFFALRGDNFDGNAYAVQALEKGASHVIIDNPSFHQREDARYILVGNALKALQDLARQWRATLDIPVIGLTGSNGKTTTKELIYSVLSTQFNTFATKGNLNNHIGVPLTLLSFPADAEVVIVEMGANQPGDIAELVNIAMPTHGLITNIGAAHLELFKSIEGVQKTKGELFDYLRAHNGLAFLNESDPRVVEAAEGTHIAATYGMPGSAFCYKIVENSLETMSLNVSYKGWDRPEVFPAQLTGAYNAMNILVAIAIGVHFGIETEKIREGIFQYKPANNRSQILTRGNKKIWMDAYNANPASMKAAISHICTIPHETTALILGDMYELGDHSHREHAALGDFINQFDPCCTILIGKEMKYTKEQLTGTSFWHETVEAAQDHLAGHLAGSTLVLLKGSRGMALERLLEYIG